MYNILNENGEPFVPAFKGDIGETPDIQIGTVTTLEPEEPATVTRTGTDEEPIFNFGIPKGEKGSDFQLVFEGEITPNTVINDTTFKTAFNNYREFFIELYTEFFDNWSLWGSVYFVKPYDFSYGIQLKIESSKAAISPYYGSEEEYVKMIIDNSNSVGSGNFIISRDRLTITYSTGETPVTVQTFTLGNVKIKVYAR